MDETLIHFSDMPLGRIWSCEQNAAAREDKPQGLWVSVESGDDGWRQWCETEGYELRRLAVESHVTLAADARILRLSGAQALDAFTAAHDFHDRAGFSRRWAIDWTKVARSYQGVIIAPYCWSRRLHDGYAWYYGWDCASGCIWDASAIASIDARAVTPVLAAAE